MDDFYNERDYENIRKDKYTFSVMSRIIGEECTLRLSDHERIIFCFTGQPFPVWIWTADDAATEEMEKAYLIARDESLLDGNHRFNVKYELAEYFIKRGKKDGLDLSIQTNLFAYDCPAPIEPSSVVDGQLHKCTAEDIDALVDFFDMFHNSVGIDKKSREEYRTDAENCVKSECLYLWKNTEGEFVSSCLWHPVNDLASIGLVFTKDEYRRKHYAEHLVYQVTKIVSDAGYLAMLYTDADYAASNACYEKIGYILRGKLCTVG